jgi:hypothetical protein
LNPVDDESVTVPLDFCKDRVTIEGFFRFLENIIYKPAMVNNVTPKINSPSQIDAIVSDLKPPVDSPGDWELNTNIKNMLI